jgi:hypothetical protein
VVSFMPQLPKMGWLMAYLLFCTSSLELLFMFKKFKIVCVEGKVKAQSAEVLIYICTLVEIFMEAF